MTEQTASARRGGEEAVLSVPAAKGQLGPILAGAKTIYVSACAAEIDEAPALFRAYRPQDATVAGIFSPMVNRQSYADADLGLRVRSFLLTRQLKRDLARGLVDHCPWRYGVIDRWLSAPGRFDTALVMMTPPDRQGNCSLGVQADFLPSFHHKVERIVGFINPQMPRTAGDTLIGYDTLAATVDYDVPLVAMAPKEPDETAVRIARSIVELVADNSTVQFGIGQIPSQVIAELGGHRGLKVHSGVVDDNILTLADSGALDPDAPIVTGTAVGTRALYDALSGNDRFAFRRVGYTHAHGAISGTPRFVAINSVLQADLFGQISSEYSGGKLVATPGGLPDFIRGAMDSDGGRSIVAVRARNSAGYSSGIVPLLDAPSSVTVSAVDADVLVTEFGVAQLRGLSLDKRAEAIMAIAAPEDRDHLAREWSRMRDGLF